MRKLRLKLKSFLGEGYLYFFLYRIAYFLRAYFIIKPNIAKSLNNNGIPFKDITKGKQLVVVPLLETSHYMNLHILALAKSFSMRDYDVLIVVCDEYLPACEIKSCRTSHKEQPCFKCNTNRNLFLKLYGLKTVTLSSLLSSIEDPLAYGKKVFNEYGIKQSAFELNIEDSVTRHFYGAEEASDKNEVDIIKRKHKESAYISLALGDVIYKKYSPDISLNVMMVYSAWGPMNQLFEKVGVVPITVSMTQFDFNSVRLNNADLFRNNKAYERFLSNRNDTILTLKENKKLDNFLRRRKTGKDNLMQEWDYFKDSEVHKLNINKQKKNVFMFTNVPWDQGLNEFAGVFKDVMDWVYKTVEYLKNDDEIDLWIKPHPAEVRGTAKSGKSVSEFIRTKYRNLPKNIHLIDAEQGISPYELFEKIDLGIVLTGTLGLEMALEGIPVISAGVNPCYGLGFLSEPKTEDLYFKAILHGSNLVRNIEEFRLFCFFYFIHQSLPWPLTKQSFGDDFNKYEFSSALDLQKGKIDDLDAIFEEIDCLINDFNADRAERL